MALQYTTWHGIIKEYYDYYDRWLNQNQTSWQLTTSLKSKCSLNCYVYTIALHKWDDSKLVRLFQLWECHQSLPNDYEMAILGQNVKKTKKTKTVNDVQHIKLSWL